MFFLQEVDQSEAIASNLAGPGEGDPREQRPDDLVDRDDRQHDRREDPGDRRETRVVLDQQHEADGDARLGDEGHPQILSHAVGRLRGAKGEVRGQELAGDAGQEIQHDEQSGAFHVFEREVHAREREEDGEDGRLEIVEDAVDQMAAAMRDVRLYGAQHQTCEHRRDPDRGRESGGQHECDDGSGREPLGSECDASHAVEGERRDRSEHDGPD